MAATGPSSTKSDWGKHQNKMLLYDGPGDIVAESLAATNHHGLYIHAGQLLISDKTSLDMYLDMCLDMAIR